MKQEVVLQRTDLLHRGHGYHPDDGEESRVDPMYQIRLFGDFQMLSAEGTGISFDSLRLQSLLAYLVLRRNASPTRAQVAFLFWPDTTDEQALNNLRTAVFRLRRVLPNIDAFLCVELGSLSFRPIVPCTIDVVDFEQALAQAEQAKQSWDLVAEQHALEEAVKLYRGDLLASCYDEWVLPERERLKQLLLGALERLIELLEGEDDGHAAMLAAQRLLSHDPLHEAAYRHLMRLYARSGNRVALVRTYQHCAAVLERELSMKPSMLTQRTYRQLACI